jgi:hypothetical protein
MPTNILNLPSYRVTAFHESDHDYHVNAIAKEAPTATCCPMYEGRMKASSFRTGPEGSKIAPFEFDGIVVRVDEHLKMMGAVWK